MGYLQSDAGAASEATSDAGQIFDGGDRGDDRGSASDVDEFGRSRRLLEWTPLDWAKMSQQKKLACQELLRRGNIEWLLHPEQKKLLDWIDQRRREIAVVCISRQFGKTF